MNSPTLLLLRGLPGSGKSTLAKILSRDGKYPVFSVDDFFTNAATGEYKFEFDKNHVAYKQCQENTKAEMLSSIIRFSLQQLKSTITVIIFMRSRMSKFEKWERSTK